MAVNGNSTAFGATKIDNCGSTFTPVARVVDTNRFGVNHKTKPAQAKQATASVTRKGGISKK